jgi:hypothetical protein
VYMLGTITALATYVAVIAVNAVLYSFSHAFEVVRCSIHSQECTLTRSAQEESLVIHELILSAVGIVFSLVVGSFFFCTSLRSLTSDPTCLPPQQTTFISSRPSSFLPFTLRHLTPKIPIQDEPNHARTHLALPHPPEPPAAPTCVLGPAHALGPAGRGGAELRPASARPPRARPHPPLRPRLAPQLGPSLWLGRRATAVGMGAPLVVWGCTVSGSGFFPYRFAVRALMDINININVDVEMVENSRVIRAQTSSCTGLLWTSSGWTRMLEGLF